MTTRIDCSYSSRFAYQVHHRLLRLYFFTITRGMFAGEVYDYAGIFMMRWAALIEIEQARNESLTARVEGPEYVQVKDGIAHRPSLSTQ